jgi:hypothetical protein
MQHARKDYDRIQDAAFIVTTILCPNSQPGCPGDCPGCLNGTFEDGVMVFRCNECGQEAGRGAFESERVGGIPKDEPVFLLRAKDKVASMVVGYWAAQAAQAGADPRMVWAALNHAEAMASWPAKQVPDMPEDA